MNTAFIKSTIATVAVLTCCLGNPADAAIKNSGENAGNNRGNTTTTNTFDDVINHDNDSTTNRFEGDVITDNSQTTRVENTSNDNNNNNENTNNNNNTSNSSSNSRSNSRSASNSSNGNQRLTNKNRFEDKLQHSNIPNPVAPVAAGSVPVITFYFQKDQVGPVVGGSISIPLQ